MVYIVADLLLPADQWRWSSKILHVKISQNKNYYTLKKHLLKKQDMSVHDLMLSSPRLDLLKSHTRLTNPQSVLYVEFACSPLWLPANNMQRVGLTIVSLCVVMTNYSPLHNFIDKSRYHTALLIGSLHRFSYYVNSTFLWLFLTSPQLVLEAVTVRPGYQLLLFTVLQLDSYVG